MVEAHPEHSDYLRWKNLTLVPYCRDLIDIRLLTKFERDYIDAYHQTCLHLLSPLLDADSLDYLQRQCAALPTEVPKEEKKKGGKVQDDEAKAKKQAQREANAAKKGGGKKAAAQEESKQETAK